MSLRSREIKGTSRRSCLRWMAATALIPLIARAGCPCDGENQDDAQASGSPSKGSSQSLIVCADPNNLPFSNRQHEGFEDKIAELVARELGMDLQYVWLPQRLGFYRTALKTFDSDVVMAAPAGFEKALITNPYYRSSYVFVCRRGTARAPRTFDDPVLRSMKIGVQLTGSDTPPTYALARRKLIDNLVGFPVFDESNGKPAEKIIAAVANGQIDVAIVWGPQAGLFVKQQAIPLKIIPVSPEEDGVGPSAMKFTFGICMAVRRSQTRLRDQINAVIARRTNEINAILDDFAVPRLALEANKVVSVKS